MSQLSLRRRSEELEIRLALAHDGSHDPAALASILAADGLAPNAGLLPMDRVGELIGNPPQAVVLAVELARADGLAPVRFVHREAPDVRIVVVAHDATGTLARQTLNAGADAFVPETDAAGVLAPAVRAVVAGLVCAPRVARRLVVRPTFSHREKEVLELLVAGLTNRQIGGRLYLAESTVKSHLASAFGKLGVRSRKDAVAILLDPAEALAATALPPEPRVSPCALSTGQAAPPVVLVAPRTSR